MHSVREATENVFSSRFRLVLHATKSQLLVTGRWGRRTLPQLQLRALAMTGGMDIATPNCHEVYFCRYFYHDMRGCKVVSNKQVASRRGDRDGNTGPWRVDQSLTNCMCDRDANSAAGCSRSSQHTDITDTHTCRWTSNDISRSTVHTMSHHAHTPATDVTRR